jgi:hypothetical protein
MGWSSRSAASLLVSLGLTAGFAARLSALDVSPMPATTLGAQLAANTELDATLDSLVDRGALPELHHAPTLSANHSQQLVAVGAGPRIITGRTQWRAAKTSNSQNQAPAKRETSSSTGSAGKSAEKPPASSGSNSANAPADKAAAEAKTQADGDIASQKGASSDGPALTPKTEDDDLAPVDELSESAAPLTDAPGDPIEPEVGDAGGESATPGAKPLSAAPKKMGDRARLPLGEPDRLARPQKAPTAPMNPDAYEEQESAPSRGAYLPPLSNNQRALRDKVRQVLKYYYDRPLNTGDRGPWEVMHCTLAFELYSRIRQGGPDGAPITAVGWLCFNQPCRNRTLMYLNEDGDLRVRVGPALQGHEGQLLAMLAQARVREDYPIKVEGQDFTIADLIEVEKSTCYPKTELTFKLIGFQRYLDINAHWVNDQGMSWDFPTLLREEMQQPIRTAACGGTHRLSGLALAVKKRRASGQPVDGAFAEAAQLVTTYQNYAFRLQNADGSFSTEWFKGPGSEPDIDRRLKTTGHILEWMVYASSDDQLTNYRTVRAVNYLANIMWANRTREWEAGPLGHAIHALVLYDRMAFAKYDAPESGAPVAKRPARVAR